MKKVTFNDEKNTIHQTCVWAFAYRQARQSNIQQLMADRDRFQRRIKSMESILSNVLEWDYRNRIYQERFVTL